MVVGSLAIALLALSYPAAAESNQACAADEEQGCNTGPDLTDAQMDSMEESVANEMKFQLLQTSKGAPAALEPDDVTVDIAPKADRSLKESVAAILATFDADKDGKISQEELKEGLAVTGADPADVEKLTSMMNVSDMTKLNLRVKSPKETEVTFTGPGNLRLTMSIPASPVAVQFRAQSKAQKVEAIKNTNMGNNLDAQALEKEKAATKYANDAQAKRLAALQLRLEAGKDVESQGVGNKKRYSKYQVDKAAEIEKEADVLLGLAKKNDLEAKKLRSDAKNFFAKADAHLKQADALANQAEHAEAFGREGTSS